MSIRFDGRVAIVTGAGGGLGRQHALALAARGAKVVVNDLGGTLDGNGGTPTAAQAVVDEIRAAGGEAIANGASVTDFAAVQAMVDAGASATGAASTSWSTTPASCATRASPRWSSTTSASCVDVHLMGAVHLHQGGLGRSCATQNYGRIVMTTSSSGLYGNFGQANYGAAKMALVGLMQTLSIEGAKNDIRVNCLAPTAATRMTEDLMPEPVLQPLEPGAVTPGPARARRRRRADARDPVRRRRRLRARLRHADAGHPRRPGTPTPPSRSPAGSDAISDRDGETVPESGAAQGTLEVGKAMQAAG